MESTLELASRRVRACEKQKRANRSRNCNYRQGWALSPLDGGVGAKCCTERSSDWFGASSGSQDLGAKGSPEDG